MLRKYIFIAIYAAILCQGGAAFGQDAYTPDVVEIGGGNGYAFAPSPELTLTNGASIEFWVQCDWDTDPGYDPVIVSNAGPKGALYTIAILGDRSGLSLQAGGKIRSIVFDFKAPQMQYVAIVDFYESAAVLVNGSVVGTFDFGFADRPSAGFWVGSADGSTAPFKGAIAGLRLWDVALGRSDLVKYSTQDVTLPGAQHPEINALIAQSDFRNGALEIFAQTQITQNPTPQP